MTFNEKLLRLHDEGAARFGRGGKKEEYNRMIRYGAFGELGENYYLYIYRDIYRNAAYYGAVIFLNKADELGNPVRVICIEQDGIEQKRPIYIRAALHFIKNQCQNTMNIAGTILQVFNLAKDRINDYIDQTPAMTKDLEDFNFKVKGQEITFEKIKIETVKRQLQNKNLDKQLDILDQFHGKTDTHDPNLPVRRALGGLNLKIEFMGLSGERSMTFQLMAVDQFKKGNSEPVKLIKHADPDKFQFEDLSPVLAKALEDFKALAPPVFHDSLRGKTINQLYFNQMAHELFSLSEDQRFCQSPELPKANNPLIPITFNKIRIRFAPDLKRQNTLKLRLTLTVVPEKREYTDSEFTDTENGETFHPQPLEPVAATITADENYTVKVDDTHAYLFFSTPAGDNYFAVPDEPTHFLTLFHFLMAGNEFFTCDFSDVARGLNRVQSKYVAIDDCMLDIYKLTLKPRPVISIHAGIGLPGGQPRLQMEFDYQGEIKQFLKENHDKELYTYDRDSQFENMCYNLLKTDKSLKHKMDYDQTSQDVGYYFYFKNLDYMKWLVENGKTYIEKGFHIYMADWKKYIDGTGSRFTMGIENKIDWLAFTPTVTYTDQAEATETAIQSVYPEANMVVDKKGKLHLLTKEEIDKLSALLRYGDRHGDAFLLPSRNHTLIETLYDQRMDDIPELRAVIAKADKLKTFEKIEDYPVTDTFNGELRGYQKEGFKWMRFLHDFDFAGCLADDMGLGKTVQTLALLQTLKAENKLSTSLLVLPVSAIPNWEAEVEKFAPGMTLFRHIGQGRPQDHLQWAEVDLVITSYATMRNDIELFTQFDFDYIILDESQNIKNLNSQVSRAAKVLKGRHRLALSGTPIENATIELWSLFDFLLPRYLGTHQWFTRQISSAIEKDKDLDQADLLKKMIFPFIMRRKKEDVAKELPEKTEIVSRVRMGTEQMELYNQTAKLFRDELEQEIDEAAVGKSSMVIFEKMLRLRQICLFPGMVDEKFKNVPSAKFDHFINLIEDILAEDHKVLVFSQFVGALSILRNHLDGEGIEYSYLDGSTKLTDRQEAIAAFQKEEDRRIFLLSLKAGGVAINLTAADYVIIFDPWWNPAVEAQAIDRSHRIGQTRKVIVYRMVVEGTIEEKILKMQDNKKELVENIITTDAMTFKSLSKEDIMGLFQ